MCPILLYLSAVAPAFAPAPVPRPHSWELEKTSPKDYTMTVKYHGRETVFDVERDVKVTINGRRGYDFVDFLTAREERAAAAQRLADGMARLNTLNLPPLSEDEIEEEIQASRQDRRARQGA